MCMFVSALFALDKKWGQPKGPETNEWMEKMWTLHIIAKGILKFGCLDKWY
jgi:hypothetical protein